MKDVIGITLRPWQRYVVDRALEHDEEGRLIWPVVVVSVARQSGKSWMARALCMWRLHKGRELFGDTQLVLHVANKRETAMEVLRPAGLWAVEQYGKRAAKWGNTSAGIEIPTGDRWIIHAANESAGVGYSVDMAFVDEAWKVKREVVDDAIAPTMAERPSPQLYLVSTAGDSTSDLLTNYRQRAIDSIDSPDAQVLLLEWSAPPEADPDDVDTWRWASPEWSNRREGFLRTQWANIDPSSWKTQFLNQWVIRANHWLTDTNWKATLDPDLEMPTDVQWNVAVESDFDGMGHAVAIAAPLADGCIAIEMQTFRTMREADAQLAHIRKTHPRTIIHVTPTYAERIQTPFEGLVGQREAPAATQNLLDLFDRQALRHNGSQTLQEHFGASTISRRQNGWVLTAPMGHGGVYGARAVMFAVWQASKTPKPVPVIRSRRRSA